MRRGVVPLSQLLFEAIFKLAKCKLHIYPLRNQTYFEQQNQMGLLMVVHLGWLLRGEQVHSRVETLDRRGMLLANLF